MLKGITSRKERNNHLCIRFIHAALSITLLALAIRLYRLGAECLWIDEGYSIRVAKEFASTPHFEFVRPLYHIFLALWMRLGQSEFMLRFPSAIFGAAAVLVLCYAGKQIVGVRASLLAGLLMAISPLYVNHSQEVRMYALTSMLTLLAMYFFISFMLQPRARYLITCILFDLLSIATFPLSALLIVVQDLVLLLYVRGVTARRWLSAQICLLISTAPMLLHTLTASLDMSPEKSPQLSFARILDLLGEFTLFARGPSGSMTARAFDMYVFGTVALVAYGSWQVWNVKREQARYVLLLLWLILPLFVTVFLAQVAHTQCLSRYVLYAAPAYLLLIGLSIDSLPSHRLKYLAMAFVLVMPTLKLVRYYERTDRPEWRQAVAFLERHVEKGDIIAVYRPGNGNLFAYYYRRTIPWKEVGYPKLQKQTPWTDQRIARILGDLPSRYRKVWLVMSQCDPRAPGEIARYVSRHYHLLGKRSFTQIKVIWFDTQRRS